MMFIGNLFGPKWKHKNPQVRKQALMTLDATREDTQNILLDVVKNDPELYIRRMAIRRLSDLDALQTLRQAASDDAIYQEATNRLCILLSNNTCELSLDQLKSRLDSLNETGIFQYVVKHTNIKEMQNYVLDKINNENAIVEIVTSAQNDEIRQLALDKLESSAALKRVIKALKRKDKRLVGQAQEKLLALDKEVAERSALTNEHKRISKDFLELVELCKLSNGWRKNESRLRSLHERWRGLCLQLGYGDKAQELEDLQQVEQAFELFESELKQALSKQAWEVAPQIANTDVIDKLQRISEQLSQKLQQYSMLDLNQLPDGAELNQFVSDIKQQWQESYDELMNDAAGSTVPFADLPQTKVEFESNLTRLEKRLAELPAIETYRAKLTSIMTSAKELLASGSTVSKRKLEKLQQQFEKLSLPAHVMAANQLHEQYQQVTVELQDRMAAQDEARRHAIDNLNKNNQELTEAIAKGRSKHAAQLVQRGKKLLKQLDEEGKALLAKKGGLAAFHQAEQQLADLQDWRKWSNAPVKEKLISDLLALAKEIEANKGNADYDFVNAVAVIKAARNEWKTLTTGEHAGDQELWQRFDAACNQAYEPCQNYFDQQAEQRAANLQLREKFCHDLEAYQQKVATQPPDEVDWKAMDKIIRAARKDWGQLGSINREDRVIINKRYNSVFHTLEKLLKTHQQQSREAKEILIQRIQMLSKQLSEQAITTDQAIESVKRAQLEWKSTGVARKESQLWNKFREACDSVFQVRRAEQDAVSEAREVEKQQRDQLITEIETASKLKGELLLQARPRVDQIKSDWAQLPRLKKEHPQERRLFRACQQFEKQIENESTNQIRAEKQKLQENVRLCYELEQAIFACLSGTVDPSSLVDSVTAVQQRWQSVSPKLRVVDQAVQDRLDQLQGYAEQIAGEGLEAVRSQLKSQENTLLQNKDMLCIQFEVLADIESPEASRQRRMEYMVSQLADKMKQSSNKNVQAEIEQMLSLWHNSGFIDPAKSQPLEQRFYSALQSLDKDYQYKI
jgi:exonuclease SbcC